MGWPLFIRWILSRKVKKRSQKRQEDQFSPLIRGNNDLRICFIYCTSREASDSMPEWWLVPSSVLIVIREHFFCNANNTNLISLLFAFMVCLLNLTHHAKTKLPSFGILLIVTRSKALIASNVSHRTTDRQCGRHVRHCLPRHQSRTLAPSLARSSGDQLAETEG